MSVYVDEKGKPCPKAGKIDYVAGWYFKAAQFMQGTNIRTAFVSTNSITQGEQVADVWQPLYERFGIQIDFAHRIFRWDSESNSKAHVHVVIIGFHDGKDSSPKRLYAGENVQEAENISPYLVAAPTVFLAARSNPLCPVPAMLNGDDRAVMAAYGFSVKAMTEAACVAELMKMYQAMTGGNAL